MSDLKIDLVYIFDVTESKFVSFHWKFPHYLLLHQKYPFYFSVFEEKYLGIQKVDEICNKNETWHFHGRWSVRVTHLGCVFTLQLCISLDIAFEQGNKIWGKWGARENFSGELQIRIQQPQKHIQSLFSELRRILLLLSRMNDQLWYEVIPSPQFFIPLGNVHVSFLFQFPSTFWISRSFF